jgi:hypothetical protein
VRQVGHLSVVRVFTTSVRLSRYITGLRVVAVRKVSAKRSSARP